MSSRASAVFGPSLGGRLSLAAAAVGLIMVVLDLVIAGSRLLAPGPAPPFVSVAWYLVILNFVFLVAFVGLAMAFHDTEGQVAALRTQMAEKDANHERIRTDQKAQLRARENAYADVAADGENISVERAKVTVFLFRVLNEGRYELPELKMVWDGYVNFVLNRVAFIMERYTGHRCAVCLKMFLIRDPFTDQSTSAADAGLLRTYMRDERSRPRRHPPDVDYLQSYFYHENAAFRDIYWERSKEDYWHANNLEELERRGEYYNKNVRYKEFYNATAVVPVKDPDMAAADSAVGFICVDNFHGGFDDKFCRGVLSMISNTVYDVYRIVQSLLSAVESDASDERSQPG